MLDGGDSLTLPVDEHDADAAERGVRNLSFRRSERGHLLVDQGDQRVGATGT